MKKKKLYWQCFLAGNGDERGAWTESENSVAAGEGMNRKHGSLVGDDGMQSEVINGNAQTSAFPM